MSHSLSNYKWTPCGLTASCLIFGFSNVWHSAGVWPTALKLDCVTNFDMVFLVIGFICLLDEIKFILTTIIGSNLFGLGL